MRNPIYRLAEKVRRGKLVLGDALAQVDADRFLRRVDEDDIAQLDRFVRALDRQDLAWSTVLAVLNVRVARRKGGGAVWGNCTVTLGWLYLQQEEWERALRHYEEALQVFEPMPNAGGAVAQIRLDLGEIRQHQDDLEAALAEYQAALTIARRLGRLELESDAHNGIGSVHLGREQTDDAWDAFRRALKLSRKNRDRRGEETALGNLGLVSRFLGRWAEAADYHRQALVISREIDHQAGAGRHLNNLGDVLLESGDLDEAQVCFQEALEIARQLGDRRGEQQRLGSLGSLYQAKAEGESDEHHRSTWLVEAEKHHRAALTLARERDDPRSQANHLANLGHVYSDLENLGEAETCYGDALVLTEKHDAPDTRWRVYYALGNLWSTQRQGWQQAFKHYKVAIEVVEKQRDRIKVESRLKFWQERAALYKQMVLCCLQLAKDEKKRLWSALEYTERARARYLADLLPDPERLSKDTLKVIRDVFEGLPENTAIVVFNVTESGAIVFIVADGTLRHDQSDDGWQVSPDGCVRAKLIEGFDRDRLQRLLVEVDDAGEVSGGYLGDYYRYIECRDSEECPQDIRRELREKWVSSLETIGADVYDELLAPAHRELTMLSVKRAVLMPNLGLSLLPLHACYESDGARQDYLLDRYEIAYAPSFGMLCHCRDQARSKVSDDARLLAIANPTGDLAWARVEVEWIRDLFPEVRILNGDQTDRATDDVVIAKAPDYTHVHFSCHGEFNLRDPLTSALFLAPPTSLTLDTILRRLKLPHTRLVVMSACETGLVDPGDLADEYIGLPSAFSLAGAPGVVSTLWAVNEMSTALLVRRFYEHHCQEGLPLADALRRAQIWLRDEVTVEHVRDWLAQAQNEGLVETHQAIAYRRDYDDLPDDARPFETPDHWAAFTVYGVSVQVL